MRWKQGRRPRSSSKSSTKIKKTTGAIESRTEFATTSTFEYDDTSNELKFCGSRGSLLRRGEYQNNQSAKEAVIALLNNR
jgi:hypothetical protein